MMRNFHLFLPLFLSLSLSLSLSLCLITYSYLHTYVHIQNAPKVCDDFQVAILIKCVECKKHKKLQSITNNMSFSIKFLLFKNYIS